ncbi:hypothetical protein EV207_13840 [Scopulibacillus darangshiensis]|uniref:Uncharacterized protein n=1 Tax=Scopulibacillus darangshiensis TaxID=442528 RepID=A0A4R2NK79_9BACL|nr:hypothetical protein [Scopulibacillus darangshiensis]TCP21953.1 hypothetical protein EV207_13840 [Scopulibacillus darangshiensis]
MAYLDPELMGVFRSKMANPWNYHRVYGMLRSYRMADLRHPGGAYGLVDGLSRCLGVPVSPEQRENAANWLMCCGVDPQNPGHQRRMWGLIQGGLF